MDLAFNEFLDEEPLSPRIFQQVLNCQDLSAHLFSGFFLDSFL